MQLGSPQSIKTGALPSAPLSLLSFAPVGSTVSSNTLLAGSMTAMTTTTAATSCMPFGAVWQHSDGGVGVAIGDGVAVGLAPPGVGVGVGAGVTHEQIRVSHGASVKMGG